jgi:hypothetical protein
VSGCGTSITECVRRLHRQTAAHANRLSALYLIFYGMSLQTENNPLSDLTVDKSFGFKY